MFVSPMLLGRVPEAFDSDDFITELKFDGLRLLLTKWEDKIRLYTRHNNEVTSLFPEIYENLEIPNGTILDGELIVPGKNGGPDFEAVMSRFKSKKSKHYLQYCVFDIIFLNNKKVTALPLIERKELLAGLEFDQQRIVTTQWIEGNAVPYFNLVKEMDLEGIVIKKSDSKYEINKRSDKWLKVINYKYQDVLITGILKKEHSYLLSSLDDSKNIGVMEFVPIEERKQIYRDMEQNGISENEKVITFKKGIPAKVKFRNWTSNGKLRIPSFHRFIS